MIPSTPRETEETLKVVAEELNRQTGKNYEVMNADDFLEIRSKEIMQEKEAMEKLQNYFNKLQQDVTVSCDVPGRIDVYGISHVDAKVLIYILKKFDPQYWEITANFAHSRTLTMRITL